MSNITNPPDWDENYSKRQFINAIQDIAMDELEVIMGIYESFSEYEYEKKWLREYLEFRTSGLGKELW